MRVAISDAETTLIKPDKSTDKMWIFGWKDYDTKEVLRFEPFRGQKEIDRAVEAAREYDTWVFHNGIGFDLPEIHRHVKRRLIDPSSVVDTLILSRLQHFDRSPVKGSSSGPHSLESWGIRLGKKKLPSPNFKEYSEEMVTYWEGDLDTTEELYEYFKRTMLDDPAWEDSIRVEHQVQTELVRQQYYGFSFDSNKAKGILASVLQDMEKLEAELQEDFPPKLEHVHSVQYRMRSTTETWPVVEGKAVETIPAGKQQDTYKGGQKAGQGKTKQVTIPDSELSSITQAAMDKYPITRQDGGFLLCYDYVPFKPGSAKDRIDVLNKAGWKPFEKTKTHQKFSRTNPGDPWGKSVPKMSVEFWEEKKAHFEVYGWAVNEDNLATLPDTAPEGAKKLAQWLTLEGRRSSLVEWLGQVQEDGRIHGSTIGIGAWTGRGAHKEPNTANISSVWPEDRPARTPVEEIKKRYDTEMRASWIVPEGSWLVGVDADGIQLRVLADYLWRHFDAPEYAETILSGDKKKGTDIHNVNRKALGLDHVTRDDAKTFIYAWVLNAGIPKVASILKTTIPTASSARNNFESSIKGLKPLKDQLIPYIAKRKWFTGYDGRKVIVPNEHKTLAGILQNSEAVVMKHSQVLWSRQLREDGINFKPLTWVHDEWQSEVIGSREEAEHVREVQKKSITTVGENLGFKIRLDGSGSIGRNWAETH